MTDDLVKITDGYCEMCKMHDELDKLTAFDFNKILVDIQKQKGHQVLIGISGGFDSSFMLWYTVKVLKLKPLVLHFDNGWNYPVAEHNMSKLIEVLGVDLVRVYKDEYYDKLCGALLLAGVKDADIANDMYMADIMQTTAKKYGVKYVFNGHDYRFEGSAPICWTYMDAKYIASVYKWAYGEELKTKHLQTFWKQIRSGVKQVRIFHYIDILMDAKIDTLLSLGLKKYGAKHGENVYTKWVGYELLPLKWGIDKRIVYLSAQVRSGYMTKEEAREQLNEGVDFEKEYYPEIERRTGVSINKAMDADKRTYKDFDYYKFKRFRLIILLMMKLKLVPYTFYKKYANG